MIIKNLTEENLGNNGKRVAGEIHWEDCNRPVNKVFFEIGIFIKSIVVNQNTVVFSYIVLNIDNI
mgnify:CR=1 FL=1